MIKQRDPHLADAIARREEASTHARRMIRETQMSCSHESVGEFKDNALYRARVCTVCGFAESGEGSGFHILTAKHVFMFHETDAKQFQLGIIHSSYTTHMVVMGREPKTKIWPEVK